MAKLSAILRNDKRKQLVEKYASVRRECKCTQATEDQKSRGAEMIAGVASER